MYTAHCTIKRRQISMYLNYSHWLTHSFIQSFIPQQRESFCVPPINYCPTKSVVVTIAEYFTVYSTSQTSQPFNLLPHVLSNCHYTENGKFPGIESLINSTVKRTVQFKTFIGSFIVSYFYLMFKWLVLLPSTLLPIPHISCHPLRFRLTLDFLRRKLLATENTTDKHSESAKVTPSASAYPQSTDLPATKTGIASLP